MNAPSGQDIWYLARDGKQHGPLTDLEMTKIVELGHLRPTDLVWRPGFTDWRPAPSVFPTIAAAEPPAPAPQPAMAAAAQSQPQYVPAQAAEPAIMQPAAQRSAPAPQPQSSQPIADISAQSRNEPRPFMPADMPQSAGPVSGSPQIGAMAAPAPMARPAPEPLPPAEPVGTSKRSVLVPLAALAVIGAVATGGFLYRDAIKTALLAVRDGPPATTNAEVPVVKADDSAVKTMPPPHSPAVAAADADGSAPAAVAAPAAVDPATIDGRLQASPAWVRLKSDYPDWYSGQIKEAARIASSGRPERDVNAQLVQAVVALRRQHADKALAASPDGLGKIASAFVATLSSLQSQSVDACYDFISKGEITEAAAAVVQKPAEGAALHAQIDAVFAAISEGTKAPVARQHPQKSDYDLLAAELGAIGWSQADIQLFADPKALSEAPREQVCKMVRDWFSAHLAVKDAAAKERLLFETLRPVVAG